LEHWRKLEKTQYLPVEELKRMQWERFVDMVRFAYHENRFYRELYDAAGIKPRDIRSREDVLRLPVVTKEDIRRNYDTMISTGFEKQRLLRFKTGGSTGKSLELWVTEECCEIHNACAVRHDRWSGWEPGEPVGALWGNPPLPEGLKGRLKKLLLSPTIYLDTMEVTEKSVREFAGEWQKVKPTLLFGHAHSIYLLAGLVRELSIDAIRPRGIISTSMMLLSNERRFIEEVFGVPVFDRYGCEEVSLIASECERHEGMHINIDHLYVEFLRDDGRYAGPGETGKIIVTDLTNRAMPFIRYQVEDVGVPSDKVCSCGRGLPLMESVTGRLADFLIRKDGTRVAGISLIENTLTRVPGIDQMQIIQESMELIVLNVVPGGSFTSAAGETLCSYLEKVFQMEIRMNLVPSIRQEKSGKYRFSICKVSCS
jgi:phenylacetate-CoA ligase